MYYSLFKALHLKDADLEPTEAPLVGFNSAPVYPLGKIRLPIRTGSKTVEVEFVVVDVPSPYNAIVGRVWLHRLGAVASTYHQVLRFNGVWGQEEVLGDQLSAKTCYVAAIKGQVCPGQVQWVEMPDAPVLEDVGTKATEKAVEDLIAVPADDSKTDRTFLLGSALSMSERDALTAFLRRNREVFAWTPYEMPGVDPTFICHRLNVDQSRRAVIQRPRRSAVAHTDAVNEEVNRLLEAGALQEVQYPTWLANTVVVKKKNGKWRVCVDYTNLNDACPKDCFPVPRIDRLVDATAGHARFSFMDAYRGYHQIAMHEPDREKTAFISPRGLFCYKVMPFGLKNAGATYQRMVTKMFGAQIGDMMEAYIDDMVVKSRHEADHLTHLQEIFDILKKHKLRLNVEKCAFGVGSGKFLGYLVTRRGIEADPNQINAISNLEAPQTIKGVQKLTGMAAALNRFISRSSDKCRPFFALLKKCNRRSFDWTPECDLALQNLKSYLSSAPLLTTPREAEPLYIYLAVSQHAVSSVLVREEGRAYLPIYYTSKTLVSAEKRYLPLEKLALALVSASRKLAPYFQAHPIIVLTQHPLKSLLHKADLSNRISKWAVELANFDIQYKPRTAIKGQVLADFIAEFTPDTDRENQQPNDDSIGSSPWQLLHGNFWKMYVDGSSNHHGSGAGVVMLSPEGILHELAIRLNFAASNNEAEYEALLAGLRFAEGLGAERIIAFSDSQLVVNQLSGDYETRDYRMSS